jgi:NADH dehydrogenase
MILVTGGTGFVGQEVVLALLKLGYKVRLLVRNPLRAGRFANNPQIELVQGDVLRPETLPAAMRDVQAVIHLVGIIVETRHVTYEQAHYEATRNLLSAAQEVGVTRWMQMSAAGTRPYASSQYHLTKWRAEELVRQSGLDWTILRPSLIYGHDSHDRLLNMIRRVLSKPVSELTLNSFPLLDGGRPLVQPVSVREVAHCFAHGLAKEASVGRTFELVGPVPLSWREMVFKIATALGKKAIYEEIPILLILRKWLWLVLVLIPLFVVIGFFMGSVSLLGAEIVAAFWGLLAVVAARWRETIVFNVPSAPIQLVVSGLDTIAPQGFRFGEPLKMAAEDNIGDPLPAAQVFEYQPESFDEGLARLLDHKTIV